MPQPKTHPMSEQKLYTGKPSDSEALELEQLCAHDGSSNQQSLLRISDKNPSNLPSKQVPLPPTRKQYSNEQIEDIKLRYPNGVLNLKAECDLGFSQHNPTEVTSPFPTTTLKRTANELPAGVNFKYRKFGPPDRPTQQAILPLTTLKRTTNDRPEDIMQMIMQNRKSDQQKEDNF